MPGKQPVRDLSGRVAVVTGAANGIGRATALRLGDAGMRVVVADRLAEPLDLVAKELADRGVPNLAVPTDVADTSSVANLRDAALDAFGSVHVVHNNAGVALPPMPIWEVDEALWRWILGVNIGGVVNGIRAFVPLLIDQDEGHVVNTSSLAGLRPGPRLGAYATTKHAVVALSEALSADLRRAGSAVGVSVVCPSAVPTSLTESSAANWPPDAPRPAGATEPRNDGSIPFTVIDPSVIADMIHDAIVEDRLFVITHPETRDVIAPRFERILAAFPSPDSADPSAPARTA